MDDSGGRRRVAGRYMLLERLGAGGMGTVWRAVDEALDTEVAIKQVRLPGDDTDHERVERARREARNAARLRGHPNIVTVFDVVTESGLPWIVMELLPARSLSGVVLTDGPLQEVDAARIGAAVLDALAYGHRRGIVHRDVKPSNILLAASEERKSGIGDTVKLGDFGISTYESDSTITVAGTIGTLDYLAPERFDGGRAEPPSDLYALGASLFEAVEGRTPFARGTTQATMKAILTGQHWPMRRADTLAPLIAALLDTDPTRRPDTDEAHKVLDDVAASTGVVRAEQPPATPTKSGARPTTGGGGTGATAFPDDAAHRATTSLVAGTPPEGIEAVPANPREPDGRPARRAVPTVLAALALTVATAALAIGIFLLVRGPASAGVAAAAPRLTLAEKTLLGTLSGHFLHDCIPLRDAENTDAPAVLRCSMTSRDGTVVVTQHTTVDGLSAAVTAETASASGGICSSSGPWYDNAAPQVTLGSMVCDSNRIFWTYKRAGISASATGDDLSQLFDWWKEAVSELLLPT